MTQTDLGGAVRDGSGGSQGSWAGRGVGLALVLGGLFFAVFSVPNALAAAGYRGVHGTVTVDQCTISYHNGSRNSRTRSGRSSSRTIKCYGNFVSDDGKSKDPLAEFSSETLYQHNDKVSIQQASPPPTTGRGGDYEIAGWEQAMFDFMIGFLGVFLTSLGILPLATGYSGGLWGGPSFKEARAQLRRSWLRPVTIGLALVGIVGAAVCFLAGLFL